MMTTRVRRRRPRVPPRKRRQPLPQFGAGKITVDNVKFSDVLAAMFGVPNPERQRGGRLTPQQMRTLMRATDPRRLGIFPKRGQRGAGLFSFITRPLARLFGKKVTKQAAKAVAKRVAKKAAKKAAAGAVTAGASWATQKALDQI